MKLYNAIKRGGNKVIAVFAVAALSVASFATTTTGGYDLSTAIGGIKDGIWTDWLEPNAAALILVLAFFVGLVLVLKLLRRFGAKTKV